MFGPADAFTRSSRRPTAHPPEASLTLIRVDASRPEPLDRQVHEAVRAEILEGRPRPGRKLAATRRLAEQLSVSRIATVLAFEMLPAEGCVQGRIGSGTFVSRELPDRLLHARSGPRRVPPDPEPDPHPIDAVGSMRRPVFIGPASHPDRGSTSRRRDPARYRRGGALLVGV